MDDNSPSQGDYAEYIYDEWNRLITEERHISQTAYTISYQYDVTSRVTKLTYPDDMQILYSYDDLNRITEIKRYIDGINDEILLENVQYNTENLLTQFDYGNTLRATFSYDSRDKISTLDVINGATPYLDLDYTYDSNSNITQIVNAWRDTTSDWHTQTESYKYDGLDRLTTASCQLWSHTYSYDKTGNRTAKDGITYTVNAVNEVTALSDNTFFTYDANGNRIQKSKGTDTWVYTYDYANNLTEVAKNSVGLGEYIYDGDGKRLQAVENSVTTIYIYSGVNILYKENTNGIATYVYGPTGQIAKRTTISQQSDTFYYHTDHLGSTRLVTDESHSIVSDVIYQPFGEPTTTGEEPYLYTGKEIDATGLYYYGARYYDPDLGRFMTRDPLAGKKAIPQSLNRYTYCANNPITLVDPEGLTYRMCNAGTGRCIRHHEWDNPHGPGWTAYDANGEKITDSKEIENLILSTDTADHARAAYLMLLVSHPEIEGDPDQEAIVFDEGSIPFYEYTVTIGGESVAIKIGISSDLYKPKGEDRIYGETMDIERGKEYQITLYQKVFSSVAFLFHIVGHEGQHVIDHIRVSITSIYTIHTSIYTIRTFTRITNHVNPNFFHNSYLCNFDWNPCILLETQEITS
jgi:RHS repeat-associated protein